MRFIIASLQEHQKEWHSCSTSMERKRLRYFLLTNSEIVQMARTIQATLVNQAAKMFDKKLHKTELQEGSLYPRISVWRFQENYLCNNPNHFHFVLEKSSPPFLCCIIGTRHFQDLSTVWFMRIRATLESQGTVGTLFTWAPPQEIRSS